MSRKKSSCLQFFCLRLQITTVPFIKQNTIVLKSQILPIPLQDISVSVSPTKLGGMHVVRTHFALNYHIISYHIKPARLWIVLSNGLKQQSA